jgi:hypothetical protein
MPKHTCPPPALRLAALALLAMGIPGTAQAQLTLEPGMDRAGSDFENLAIPADPELCRAKCAAHGRCKAYTYVKPGVQGPSARCYLKDPAPPATPNPCCTSGVKEARPAPGGNLSFEPGMDRAGSDYEGLDIPPEPKLCRERCAADARCKAYTYVKPGVQGPSARCYLKDPAPDATRNDCCTSGVRQAAAPSGGGVTVEPGVDRPGSDFMNVEIPARPERCKQLCEGNERCKAYTYVKPGVQGPSARCYLKDPAPDPTPNACCTSGVKGQASTPPPAVKGPNVRGVYYAGGAFKSTGPGQWSELKTGKAQPHATFKETGRDEWSVYLKKHDGASVQLDLWKKKVIVNGNETYTIDRVE